MTPADALVAVVIVNYRTPEDAMNCVKSLQPEKQRLPHLRVVVVDGGSGDGSAEKLERDTSRAEYRDWVSFLGLQINGGYGWANNQAILTLARDERPPEFIHVLNPDVEVGPGAVVNLVRALQSHARCGAAGSRVLTPDGRAPGSAFRFPSAGREFLNAAQSERIGRLLGIGSTVVECDRGVEVDWVTGASVMFRSSALRESGLFDDGFFLYFEEVELMHRLKSAGWKIRHVPESRVVHAEGSSTGLGAVNVRTMPAYWYQSRQRYFGLTRGRMAGLCANFAWVAGRFAAKAKSAAGRAQSSNPRSALDMFRAGIAPGRSDRTPSIPAWGDPPGRPPAWMSRS